MQNRTRGWLPGAQPSFRVGGGITRDAEHGEAELPHSKLPLLPIRVCFTYCCGWKPLENAPDTTALR